MKRFQVWFTATALVEQMVEVKADNEDEAQKLAKAKLKDGDWEIEQLDKPTIALDEVNERKDLTIDEMKEDLAPILLDQSFSDGADEDIVWSGFKGLDEMTNKEVKDMYKELCEDEEDK